MSYKDGEVVILQVDPFHPVLGHLFPLMLQRMVDFAKVHYAEISPMAQARDHAVRACAGDPDLLLLALLGPDGKLIGHSVATVQETYGRRWLFVTQCKADESSGDAIARVIKKNEEFARARGADILIFETRRSDSAWAKAYGFKTMRHLMSKSLNGQDYEVVESPDLKASKGA